MTLKEELVEMCEDCLEYDDVVNEKMERVDYDRIVELILRRVVPIGIFKNDENDENIKRM